MRARPAAGYREIHRRAVAEPDARKVVEHVLVGSVEEFTQPADAHPGCLVNSAVMVDSPSTLDATAYIGAMQRADERALLARFEQAARNCSRPRGSAPN